MRVFTKTVETRKYSKFDSEQFRNDPLSIPFDEIKSITVDPDEMWAMWKRFIFLDVFNKHSPLTNIKVKGKQFTIYRFSNQTFNKATRLSEKERKSNWVKIP